VQGDVLYVLSGQTTPEDYLSRVGGIRIVPDHHELIAVAVSLVGARKIDLAEITKLGDQGPKVIPCTPELLYTTKENQIVESIDCIAWDLLWVVRVSNHSGALGVALKVSKVILRKFLSGESLQHTAVSIIELSKGELLLRVIGSLVVEIGESCDYSQPILAGSGNVNEALNACVGASGRWSHHEGIEGAIAPSSNVILNAKASEVERYSIGRRHFVSVVKVSHFVFMSALWTQKK